MGDKKTVVVDGDELTIYGGGTWLVDARGKKWSSADEYRYFKAKRPQRPVGEVKYGAMGGTCETHRAFGLISASRCTTTGVTLFGSDFKHGSFVNIHIHRAELNRTLSKDWPHPREELIEVSLSEAQWATFVSSLNNGIGVQCTIDTVRGEQPIPAIAINETKREQFKAEASEDIRESEARIDEALALVRSGKLRKGELETLLIQAKNKLTGGVNFVAKSFGEHVENTVEHGKVEVEAYVQSVLQRAGAKALVDAGTLKLERGEDEP